MLNNIKIGDIVFFVNVDKIEKHTGICIKDTLLGENKDKTTIYQLDGIKKVICGKNEYDVEINSTETFLFSSEEEAKKFMLENSDELRKIKESNDKLDIKIS